MIKRLLLTRSALVATIAGIVIGAAAGFVSLRRVSPIETNAPPAVAVIEPVPVATKGTEVIKPAEVSSAKSGSTVRQIGLDRETVPQQASALALRGDVAALLAMRERLRRQTEQAGEEESSDLDLIDRYLTEARERRLRLDGEQLRGHP